MVQCEFDFEGVENMATCMSNVLALRTESYQALKERVEVEEKGFVSTGVVRRRSIRSLKGGSRIGPSSFEACVLRSSGALVALSPQKKTVGSDALTFLVCRAGADGGPSELEPSSESSKPKESFKLLLRLVWFFLYCSFYFFLIRGFL